MKAVVLEKQGAIQLREMEIAETLGPEDVRIAPAIVGICGSDVHYFTQGRIGDFVLRAPMVLGHEASGRVVEVGANVCALKVGDRVCMEPGIPNFQSAESLCGSYNVDPTVRFWATPPVHGCLRETVVHPACLTFPLPDSVSLEEGALVEPLATGVFSVRKSGLGLGDCALVLGAGTIGLVTALAAKAAGCGKVFVADVAPGKLDFLRQHYPGQFCTIDLQQHSLQEGLAAGGEAGVDGVFEASGSSRACEGIAEVLLPNGALVLIGMPNDPISLNTVSLQVKEIRIMTVFRYCGVFAKVIQLLACGLLSVQPLITRRFPFAESCAAFDYAASAPASEIKIIIEVQ